jgi:hypothetical protein
MLNDVRVDQTLLLLEPLDDGAGRVTGGLAEREHE